MTMMEIEMRIFFIILSGPFRNDGSSRSGSDLRRLDDFTVMDLLKAIWLFCTITGVDNMNIIENGTKGSNINKSCYH